MSLIAHCQAMGSMPTITMTDWQVGIEVDSREVFYSATDRQISRMTTQRLMGQYTDG